MKATIRVWIVSTLAVVSLAGCAGPNAVCDGPFDCAPAPGYVWADPSGFSYETVWQPGSTHPIYKNIRAEAQARRWAPQPGYAWAFDDIKSLQVRWRPGARSASRPNMKAGEREGQWVALAGYKLEYRNTLTTIDGRTVRLATTGNEQTGRQVAVWDPGQAHPRYARTYAGELEGTWGIEAGYVRSGKYGARWQRGLPHPQYPNVVSTTQIGRWKPAIGYQFASSTGLEVKPKDSNFIFGPTKQKADENFNRFLGSVAVAIIAGGLGIDEEDDSALTRGLVRPVMRGVRDAAVEDAYKRMTGN